jgi:murein DD-endopeptidase MepM/ murein hydrolase activator NlpD
MRRGVCLLLIGVLVAAATAASAYADSTDTTTTPTTTTTSTTTTSPATTSAPTPTTPTQVYSRLSPAYLPDGCVGAGDAAIAVPGRSVLVLGTPAYGRGPSSYPTKGPIVRFLGASASGSSCTGSQVALESVSLFGGAVTAHSVSATHGRGYVSGLAIYGSPVSLGAGHSTGVGGWGEVTVQKTVGRITAPLVVQLLAAHRGLPAGTTIAFAFAASAQTVAAHPKPKHHSGGGAHGSKPNHDAGSSQKSSGHAKASPKNRHAHRARHARPVAQPLTATPSLGYRSRHFVFPIDGGASYVDTYGGNRNDIYDGWHHGDDLFAPLGTPVVAVARGTLSLVGWNTLGGWRLWLTDRKGNSFYYAHLAGYARWILTHPHVRAGQVIGFLGRTGDAFTTPPHLHFEIHPHLYVALGYDGAVDPTRYLQSWKVEHVPAAEIPRPAKLRAPVGIPRQEAAVVWRQLLVARHLRPAKGAPRSGPAAGKPSSARASRPVAPFPHPPSYLASGASPLRLPGLAPASARVSAAASNTPLLVGGPLGGALVLVAGAGTFLFRRRRRAETPPAVPEASS